MATDPVALAFANANRPRAELDALYAKQQQAGQQVLQAANMFRSWSDRAASMEESKRQFDVTQSLRERQFVLNQEQSMAQLSAAKVQQDREALMLRQQQQKLDEQPLRDAANAKLYGSLSNVTDETQLQEAYRNVTSDPLVAKFVPPSELNQTFLSAKQNLLTGTTQTLLMKQKVDNQEILNQYLTLGGNPEDVTNVETGQIDYNTLRMATGELLRTKEAKDLAARTEAQKQLITARGDQSIKALQAKEDSYAAKISDVTQRAKFQEYMKMARSAAKNMDDVAAKEWENRADAVFNGTQEVSQGAVPPLSRYIKPLSPAPRG